MTYIHCLTLRIHSIKLYHCIKLTFSHYSTQYIQLPSTYWLWEQCLTTFVFLNISPEHSVPRINNYHQSGLPRAGSRRLETACWCCQYFVKILAPLGNLPNESFNAYRVLWFKWDPCGSYVLKLYLLPRVNQTAVPNGTALHKPTLTSDTNCKLGAPLTTVRFDSSLEELVELTESSYTHSYSLLQEQNTDLKLKERTHEAGPWRVPHGVSPAPSLWTQGALSSQHGGRGHQDSSQQNLSTPLTFSLGCHLMGMTDGPTVQMTELRSQVRWYHVTQSPHHNRAVVFLVRPRLHP